MTSDVLPTILGIILVAAAAAFALVPFARGARADSLAAEPGVPDCFVLYRQVMELEFDHQLGKLSAEDLEQQSQELMAEAGHRHALLVAPGDVDAMAISLSELAANRDLRAAMGAEGARRQRERWSADVMVEGYARVLDEVCSRSRPPRDPPAS